MSQNSCFMQEVAWYMMNLMIVTVYELLFYQISPSLLLIMALLHDWILKECLLKVQFVLVTLMRVSRKQYIGCEKIVFEIKKNVSNKKSLDW